jgi:hypothetical protein
VFYPKKDKRFWLHKCSRTTVFCPTKLCYVEEDSGAMCTKLIISKSGIDKRQPIRMRRSKTTCGSWSLEVILRQMRPQKKTAQDWSVLSRRV